MGCEVGGSECVTPPHTPPAHQPYLWSQRWHPGVTQGKGVLQSRLSCTLTAMTTCCGRGASSRLCEWSCSCLQVLCGMAGCIHQLVGARSTQAGSLQGGSCHHTYMACCSLASVCAIPPGSHDSGLASTADVQRWTVVWCTSNTVQKQHSCVTCNLRRVAPLPISCVLRRLLLTAGSVDLAQAAGLTVACGWAVHTSTGVLGTPTWCVEVWPAAAAIPTC